MRVAVAAPEEAAALVRRAAATATATNAASLSLHSKENYYSIMYHPGGQSMVTGATRMAVTALEEAAALVRRAAAARACEATATNAASLRLHSKGN